MTSTPRFARVRDLFEAVIDLDPSAAQLKLADVDSTEPEVAAEVRSLLEHHSLAGHFLDTPAAALTDDAENPGLPVGEMVGPYRVEREIGRGGMGRVYLATDTRLHRPVALKVLPASVINNGTQRERLRREARAAAQLSHPGICTIFALEEIDDRVMIAAEFIDGRSLRDEIATGRMPTAADVERAALELLDAMASAHARGITHRDLKPENIMRGRDGRLKILDFGLALIEAPALDTEMPRLTIPGAILGTPEYMAPEQLKGDAADARSDVFALGVVLYEYATGAHPFSSDTPLATAARILEGAAPPLRGRRPELPVWLIGGIERAIAKRPADRFVSAAVFAQTLREGALPPPPADGAVVAAWWRRHQIVAIVLYVLASAVAWQVKEWVPGVPRLLFPLVGILAVVGGVLRGHLLFAERANHRSFAPERQRASRMTAATDLAMGLALLFAGALANDAHQFWSLLVMALGVGIALARLVVERATTQGAFGEQS